MALAIIACIAPTTAPLAAMDFLVGAKIAYVGWHPFLIDVGDTVEGPGWKYLDEGSGLMYGPNVALMLTDKINLGVSYLYGNLSSNLNKRFTATEGPNTNTYDTTGQVDIIRQDVDATLSYSLSPAFKIFAGAKYQPIKVTIKSSGAKWGDGYPANEGAFFSKSQEMNAWYLDPAVGVGLTLPLSEKLVFTINLSALYITGKFKVNKEKSVEYVSTAFDTPVPGTGNSFEMDMSGYGANLEPGLAFIMSENLFIMLGARIQYTRLSTEPSGGDTSNAPTLSGLNDIIYGGYVSVIYKI